MDDQQPLKEHQLKVYNSLAGAKESFVPIKSPFVGMYVCGPTVYNYVHLGNCRTFISFDMIYRYLTHLGYKVRYVRNITDAGHLEEEEGENKIMRMARLERLEPMEIVARYTRDFHKVLAMFNNIPPNIEPTATGHIVEQIDMINDIIKAGLAYEVNGSVYFDVPKYHASSNYGKLSGRNIEELLANTREELEGQSEKRDPRDFALWKKASPTHIMRWNSPWSDGFPGWHLECSVMSSKYLGKQFDIHGGGMDLKFPHHECEIAQNKAACGVDAVKYWLHTNMLTINGTKMSKSAGNAVLPMELFTGDNNVLAKGYDPIVVRFFMMQAHYRSPLDFSDDALLAAEKGFERLMTALNTLRELKTSDATTIEAESLITKAYAAMDDDFNTPVMIAHLFDGVRAINSVAAGTHTITQEDKERLISFYESMALDILGLKEPEEKGGANTELVDQLMDTILDLRAEARSNKDWGTADKIRDALQAMNISVKDSKEGATWTIEN